MALMFGVVGVVGALVLVVSLVFDDALDAALPEAGWISGPVIGACAAVFGLVGWVAQAQFDAPTPIAAAAGIAGGVAIGWSTGRLALALMRTPTDATPTAASLVGAEGRVVTPVRGGGLGEVVVGLGGAPVKLTATAEADLPVGTRVTVVAVHSSTKVLVESTDRFWS